MIEVKNLSHIYNEGSANEFTALSDINFRINDGEFVGLIGHTGSGKSTLVQILSGVITPSCGNVYVNGEDLFENKSKKRNLKKQIGIVFQYPEHQLFEETVYKDIAFGPKNMGLSEEEIDKRVRDAAKCVGLTEKRLAKSPFDLSGGQKRRCAIAGVIAMNPKVIILDEPTAGLDPLGRDEILKEISLLHKKGITVILISHSMEDIAKYTDRVLVLNHGKIVADSTARDIFSDRQRLLSVGLDTPQINRVMSVLNLNGINVESNVLTVEEATGILLPLLKEEKK